MPAKSGGSHAFTSFATLLIGAVLSKYVWTFAPPLGEASLFAIETIRSLTGVTIPVNEQFAGIAVIMVTLSFLWGVVYHVGRHW
ncbi:hypothetical protein [Haloparvum sp. PAK95]|uniref:hypothetical protein n=1 Tax=Haloparvum sp. PAK95 TaxID=3418962 RepID=UPI003D2EA2E5